jgi:protein required for attachment to host cells
METSMLSPQSRTWVLVADSAKARAVRWVGHSAPMESVECFDLHYHHQYGRDMMSERPGRTHESQGATRHAIEPRSDPVREAERRFAATVVENLKDRFAKDEFSRLVLVAVISERRCPPRSRELSMANYARTSRI